jgi:CBS domain-containing protein
MRAGEVMQKGVISVSPELSLADLEEFLTTEDIGGAPVLGSAGQVVGIVSKTDIVRALSDENGRNLSDFADAGLTVEDVMTHDVLTVKAEDDVREVARQMIDLHVHRLLVCDGEEVVGIITAFDLLRALAD